MTDPDATPPWTAAWLATQRDFAMLASLWPQLQAGAPELPAPTRPFEESYRRLFEPRVASGAGAAPQPGEALQRYQRAAARYGQVLMEVAGDAGRRLSAALAATGPGCPPITTLRELHALWIECGEAAWSAAAHGEAFACAQAELLGALVELRARTPTR